MDLKLLGLIILCMDIVHLTFYLTWWIVLWFKIDQETGWTFLIMVSNHIVFQFLRIATGFRFFHFSATHHNPACLYISTFISIVIDIPMIIWIGSDSFLIMPIISIIMAIILTFLAVATVKRMTMVAVYHSNHVTMGY